MAHQISGTPDHYQRGHQLKSLCSVSQSFADCFHNYEMVSLHTATPRFHILALPLLLVVVAPIFIFNFRLFPLLLLPCYTWFRIVQHQTRNIFPGFGLGLTFAWRLEVFPFFIFIRRIPSLSFVPFNFHCILFRLRYMCFCFVTFCHIAASSYFGRHTILKECLRAPCIGDGKKGAAFSFHCIEELR